MRADNPGHGRDLFDPVTIAVIVVGGVENAVAGDGGGTGWCEVLQGERYPYAIEDGHQDWR